jgi:hypothetical protein
MLKVFPDGFMIDTKNTHFRKDNPRNIPAKFVFKEFCGLNFFLKNT